MKEHMMHHKKDGHHKMHWNENNDMSSQYPKGDKGGDHYMHNDESKVANMPQEVKMVSYPQERRVNEVYGDDMEFLDYQNDQRTGTVQRNYKPRR